MNRYLQTCLVSLSLLGGVAATGCHSSEDYSRKDKAWQLVRVEEENFNANDPDKGTTKVFTPPKDFGKIDFRDFDPEDFKGKGEK